MDPSLRFSFIDNNEGEPFGTDAPHREERFLEVANLLEGLLPWGSNETIVVFYNPDFVAQFNNAEGIAYRSPTTGMINIGIGDLNPNHGVFRSIVAEEIYHAAEISSGLLPQPATQIERWQAEVRAINFLLEHRELIDFNVSRRDELRGLRDDYEDCIEGNSNTTCQQPQE